MCPTGFTSLDDFHYHHALATQPGLGLVLFSTRSCGACRVAEQHLPAAAPSGVALFYVDAQTNLARVKAMGVFHLPALFLYRDGHFHARLECEMTPTALAAAIQDALAAPPQEEP